MKAIVLAAMVSIAGVGAAPAFAERDYVYTKSFNNNGAGGYDVVSYFEGGEPVKGDKSFKTEYKGANFLFSSQDNLDKFLANSEAYMPQYGGYCAWALAEGKLFKGDPLEWTVLDGKLYFNYSNKIQAKWTADPQGFITAADPKWPNILSR